MLIRQRLFFLFSLWLLASCSGEDIGEIQPDKPQEERIPIRFEIGFVPETRVEIHAGFNNTWVDGDEIGVFIVKGNDGLQASGNYVDNLKLTYTRMGWSQEVAQDKVYYPTDGSSLSFYAYYPYQAAIDPTDVQFSIQLDQRAKNNYEASVFLIAKTLDYRLDPAVIPLNFSHAYALLQIQVVQEGDRLPEDDLDLTIKDIATTVNANLITDPVTGTTEGQLLHMYKEPGLTATYRALIPPQTLSGNEIIFYHGVSPKKSYTGLQPVTLEAGTIYKYKLTVTDLAL